MTIPVRDITPPRRLGIKNLLPGLAERGKIKIGNKGATRQSRGGGEYQLPQKLDHFLITTTARGDDGNFVRDAKLHQVFGDRPTELPVILLYDDIHLNFATRYACYNGRTAFCSGDGEVATRLQGDGSRAEVGCVCERVAPDYKGQDKCKPNGTLSVIIQGAEVVGGVWKLRTTSFNTITGILSSLALIKSITGGPLAGIPLWLCLSPKSVADPNTGKSQTVYVVSLEFRGSVEQLQDKGYKALLSREQHHVRIEQIEDEARRLIEHNPLSYAAPPEDEIDDELDEFYPVAEEDPAPAPTVKQAGRGSSLEQMAESLDDPGQHQGDDQVQKAEAPAPKPDKPKPARKPAAKPAAKTAAAPVTIDQPPAEQGPDLF